MSPESLMLPEEAAAYLRISLRTLLRKSSGRKPIIPCIRISRKIRRFHRETILAAWGMYTSPQVADKQ